MQSNQLHTLKLNQNEIHLWLAFPDEIQDIALLSAYDKLMSEEERTHQQRFHFAKHQHQYLITRALVRTTLSRYTDVDPSHWQFDKNQYGRPEIHHSDGLPPLRFNLSHTDGLIICGVVLKQDIGVDVEDTERKGAPLEIADRFFSAQEVHDLNQVPDSEKRERFFNYWTLKESYIKARGMGLSLPLEQFTFLMSRTEIQSHQPLRISFAPQLHDVPNQWQFWLLQATQRHQVAISLRRDEEVAYQLSLKKVVPLREEQSFSCSVLLAN
jgi:4'-phosphopantetheinyl transferase